MGKIVQLLDQYTNETVNFEVIPNLPENAILDGVIFAQKNGTYYKRVINDGIVKPEWWGAKGDGVTDDTLSILSAINYCQNSLYKNLHLLRSSYLITQSVVISNINFVLNGKILTNVVDSPFVIKFQTLFDNNIKISLENQRLIDYSENVTAVVFEDVSFSKIDIGFVQGYKNACSFGTVVNAFRDNIVQMGFLRDNENYYLLNNISKSIFQNGKFILQPENVDNYNDSISVNFISCISVDRCLLTGVIFNGFLFSVPNNILLANMNVSDFKIDNVIIDGLEGVIGNVPINSSFEIETVGTVQITHNGVNGDLEFIL